jgi:thiamine pyrophosphokinase
MRVLILANGEPPSERLIREVAGTCDLILATDGAANTADALGIAPDLITGDFDSIQMDEARTAFPMAAFLHTPDQDRADLEKAIEAVRSMGATEMVIIGAGGGRADHSLAAVSLLIRYHREVDICLRDERSTVRVLSAPTGQSHRHTLATRPGDTVSLLSLDETVYVSIEGVQWPLRGFLLPIGTQGVSNVALGESVNIEVSGGRAIICHLPAPTG